MRVEEFDDFYHEIHGVRPFPWQRDLVREIVRRKEWPSLVDVPTGLGKTTLLDTAVFMCALDADSPYNERVGRRRIFFVVDRRIVVDQAKNHADVIAEALAKPAPGSATARVADRLRGLVGSSSSEDLLPVVRMRGGITWDAAWLRRPDIPAIVTGTVDQVGSRLFFRGYGVSSRRWPIDAALVGTDSLVLVDEAHLATSLTTTLAWAETYDKASNASLGVPPAVVIQLTATAHRRLSGWIPPFDEQAHLADPIAKERLTAAKTLTLTNTTRSAAVKAIASAASKEADAASARVLVVCNTIDRARAVHTELARTLPKDSQLLLLIGRSRQHDREPVVARALELFRAGRPESTSSAVLVATQTVEVGIDLDATSLVTESASWDALVQRMGRVNRRGLQADAPVVVVHDDDPKPPVYGLARTQTIGFINELLEAGSDQLDVSPLGLRHLSPPPDALLPQPTTPLLLPAHLDAWARTAPPPVNDAPLDAYLHGFDSGVAPVSLAWRDGLLDADGAPVTSLEANQAIDAIPVRAEECVDVPLSAVRRWLTGEKAVPVSDWDDEDDWEIPFSHDATASVLRRSTQSDGTASWQWVQAAALRPGDMVVVPSESGGLDRFGWAPSSTERVLDVAELAALDRDQPLLRLDEGLPRRLGLTSSDTELWDVVHQWRTTDDPETKASLGTTCEEQVRSWLSSADREPDSPWDHRSGQGDESRRARLIKAMDQATLQAAPLRGSRNERHVEEQRFLVPIAVMRSKGRFAPWQEASDDTADGTTHLDQRVTLRQHGQAVGDRAKEIAIALRLPERLTRVIADAASWHDLGKADPRFQAMLFDGDPVRAAIASEPLAKSGMPPGDLQRHWDARRRSGLPRRVRHESWSHALVARYLVSLHEAYPGDTELLLHLVASHHGHARPLLPPVLDQADHALVAEINGTSVSISLPRGVDLEHAERFLALNRRYGRWGLALLEAIVRCADMTVSGEGS